MFLLVREKMSGGSIFREKWNNRERIHDIFNTTDLVKWQWKLSTLMNFIKSIDRNVKKYLSSLCDVEAFHDEHNLL